MKRQQRKYNKEFKVMACELVNKEGVKVATVAEKLGINTTMLYRWLDEYKEHGEEAFVGSGKQRASDAEFRKLKKENELLKLENEILKKAAAYFAKEQKDE